MEIDPQYPVVSDEARRDLMNVKEELEAEAPKGAAADPFEARLAKERRKAKRKKGEPQTGAAVAGPDDGGSEEA